MFSSNPVIKPFVFPMIISFIKIIILVIETLTANLLFPSLVNYIIISLYRYIVDICHLTSSFFPRFIFQSSNLSHTLVMFTPVTVPIFKGQIPVLIKDVATRKTVSGSSFFFIFLSPYIYF